MASSKKLSDVKAMDPRLVILAGSFAIGSSGAIASQDSSTRTGGTVSQIASEDGRYHVDFTIKVKTVLACGGWMFGPADDAFPTTTGSDPQGRNKAVTGFDIQFKAPDAQDDVDPASGTVGTWWALVSTK